MMEKSTTAYTDFVQATLAELAKKLATGEISEEEYRQVVAELGGGVDN